jgi:hypothetical protein
MGEGIVRMNIELEPEQIEDIMLLGLHEGLQFFEEALSDRQNNENALAYFSHDRDEDINKITVRRDAFLSVLSYYRGSEGLF